jgi:two-component system, response regulator YesN
MYRLLIADDEHLERKGLELIIERTLPNTFQFMQAENGRMAIQLTDEFHPDIVMMDIKMPGINGIEALKEIRILHPHVKMILLTAYDHFTYAKEAISIGVKDYILKPAKKDQLQEILQNQIKEIEAEKLKRREELATREKLSQFIPLAENEFSIMLMLNHVQEVDLLRLASFLDFEVDQGNTIVITFTQGDGAEHELFNVEKKNIHEALKSKLKEQARCVVGPIIGSQMAVFLEASGDQTIYFQRVEAIQLAKKLNYFIKQKFSLNTLIGIGSVYPGVEGLRRSYHEATLAASDTNVSIPIRHFGDMQLKPQWDGFSLHDEKELLDAIKMVDESIALQHFDKMFDQLIDQTGRNVQECLHALSGLFSMIARHLLRSGYPMEGLSKFGGVQQVEQLRGTAEFRIRQAVEILKQEKEKRTYNVLDRVKEFIQDHYQDKISIEQVAEHVNLSPYYLSKLFRLEMGENFIDYLTGLRVEKAKQLMTDSSLSMKEICYLAGYRDPNYFSRVFKKATGLSPSEYRNGL